MTVTNPFEKFILRKADKAPDGPYWTAIQILKNAVIAGKLPVFNRRPSSATLKRYFDLVPPGLRAEAAKVYQNYQRSERYEASERYHKEQQRLHANRRKSSAAISESEVRR